MTSFLVTWFSNLHILWDLPKAISLQNFNAVGCLGQVLQRDWKHNDDVIMTSFRIFGIRDFHIFCETGYRLSTCQVSNLSVI